MYLRNNLYLVTHYVQRLVGGPKGVDNYVCLGQEEVSNVFLESCATGGLFLKAIETDVSDVIHIVKAICICHNVFQQHEAFHPENHDNLITEFGNKLWSHRPTRYCFPEKLKK
jgi:hypothetical protein